MAHASRHDLARVAGPDSMAKPTGPATAAEANGSTASTSANPNDAAKAKKKRHRGGKKKKNRRQSFAAPSEATEDTTGEDGRPSLQASRAISAQQASFYRLQSNGARSNTSLESDALLDHREQAPLRSRRDTMKTSLARAMPFSRTHRSSTASNSRQGVPRRGAPGVHDTALIDDEDDDDLPNDRTPLMSHRNRSKPELSRNNSGFGYGSHGTHRGRRQSKDSKASSRRRLMPIETTAHNNHPDSLYDVNNPPSVPASPTLDSVDDLFIPPGSDRGRERDAIINIEGLDDRFSSASPEGIRRRATVAELAERDVCFPLEEEDGSVRGEESIIDPHRDSPSRRRRRRGKLWPDLEVLEEWARDEKEERTHQDLLRAKKISEPVMVGGRLRPGKTTGWHAQEDDAPFRFTYFNESLDGTVHARTISDLLQDGMSFKELFRPDPIELSDSSSDEEDNLIEVDETASQRPQAPSHRPSSDGEANKSTLADNSTRLANVRSTSIASKPVVESAPASGRDTPKPSKKKFGPKPTFWLDVLSPTESEMKVLVKAFGLHQLTAEDILMDEQREKVELFPSYYFINYRTFEQDKDSEDYMDPINMFVVVFRHGLITFHHKMSPHPANVRRRIRQLNDYMSPTADWISYAIIDDVTDAYGPLVTEFEAEVDDIDEEILLMHTTAADAAVATKANQPPQKQEQRPKSSKGRRGSGNSDKPNTQGAMGAQKAEDAGEKTAAESGGAMLRRIGTCRKTVMGMYRLLGNKADVIKGFAKRCNEHWEVAPRSEIGLYLGDIQDHIVTMTGNLSHFESLLSRAHSNYVAQINIRMNERAEQNADILGKLTVLGTIVLPMNIITGMWGMNVWVPGQEIEGDLTWFFCITAGLVAFGVICYMVAKRVYGIV